MRIASILILTSLLWPTLPSAQVRITDGDTLHVGGVVYRLWGIDAPETHQLCDDGFPAGRLATEHLRQVVEGRSVVCTNRGHDRYGRTIGLCRVGGENIGATMVADGWAYAFTRYSLDYVTLQQESQKARRGLHAHECMMPWEWRRVQKRR